MHISDLISRLAPTGVDNVAIPLGLLGSFRRKSITFSNGQTDEQTIVYWFQSRSFTIDIRLHDANETKVTERQGWIGSTLWDCEAGLLSWDVRLSYQPRIQWPEPARIFAIGNSILEFAPSGVYAEDWRQQSTAGVLLGLRLVRMRDERSGEDRAMDGGLVLAGEHMACVQPRLPSVEGALAGETDLDEALAKGLISLEAIESYEVSIALGGSRIAYSTQGARVGMTMALDGFEVSSDGCVTQSRVIGGNTYTLTFAVDIFEPNYRFVQQTACEPDAAQWMKEERAHLFRNALIVG